MIPLQYRLRDPVRVEQTADGSWWVVCESPLSVLVVNASAVQLLELTRHGATVDCLAVELHTGEDRILHLCEYLRGRGILAVGAAAVDTGFVPTVSVIVPTRDRADDLDECLGALGRLDYPGDRLEVIVVDDGSLDPAAVERAAAQHGARLLVNDRNRGPSYSRNRAAREAAGDVLAFIDSDCVAGSGWLRELIPYFSWERVGAVGGRTVGYYSESRLDRYEEASSPLDMGRHLLLDARGTSTFYVPTCNLLVRSTDYKEVGGLREDLPVGEDVDLCWRLRARRRYLVYAPAGKVRHKHRRRLGATLRRRAAYGTSEAPLHALHQDKRKRFPVAAAPLATAALLSVALSARRPLLLPACLAPIAVDGSRRLLRLREAGIGVPARRVWASVFRGHLSMLYFVYFHLVRYYYAPLAAVGLLAPGARVLAAAAVLYAGSVDYATRKPRLSYPVYLFYYLAEHVAYQAGVMLGCAKARSLRSYLPGSTPAARPVSRSRSSIPESG